MHRFWAFHLVLFSIYSEMASWSCSSEHWWKGKSLGHRGSRDWSLIILSTLIPCTHNPPGIEQQQDFYEVNHLQGPKVKSTLLSIYELLSALQYIGRQVEHYSQHPPWNTFFMQKSMKWPFKVYTIARRLQKFDYEVELSRQQRKKL